MLTPKPERQDRCSQARGQADEGGIRAQAAGYPGILPLRQDGSRGERTDSRGETVGTEGNGGHLLAPARAPRYSRT